VLSCLKNACVTANIHPPKLTDTVHTSCAVSAVEQLQVMASKRQYKEAAAQLEVRQY
jgi:hypothetical protein